MLAKASSYPDDDTLLVCVNDALARFTPAVAAWLAAEGPRRLVIDGDADRPVGVVMFTDGRHEESPLYRVVLVKDARAKGGWTLRTTFLRRPCATPGFAVLETPVAHLVGAYLNEDVDDYDAWQIALAEMAEDAPDLYAALPAELESLLRRDDASLTHLLDSLDFGFATDDVDAREFLEGVRLQIRVIEAAHDSLRRLVGGEASS